MVFFCFVERKDRICLNISICNVSINFIYIFLFFYIIYKNNLKKKESFVAVKADFALGDHFLKSKVNSGVS